MTRIPTEFAAIRTPRGSRVAGTGVAHRAHQAPTKLYPTPHAEHNSLSRKSAQHALRVA